MNFYFFWIENIFFSNQEASNGYKLILLLIKFYHTEKHNTKNLEALDSQ